MSDTETSPAGANKALHDLLEQIAIQRKRPLLSLVISYVSRSIVFKVKEQLGDKQLEELDVVLNTPGGDIDAAFSITKLLRRHAKKVNIIVPSYAKSAGTLICLGADEILMTELAELGPLDSQLPENQERVGMRYSSALNGSKALEQVQQHCVVSLEVVARMLNKLTGLSIGEVVQLATEFCGKTSATLYSKLDPKSIGEYARALDVGLTYGVRILTDYMQWPEEKATQTVRDLVHSYPSHGYVIDHDELVKLGLPAKHLDGVFEGIFAVIGETLPSDVDIIEMIPYVESQPNVEAKSTGMTVEKERVQPNPETGDNKGKMPPPEQERKQKPTEEGFKN